MSYLRFTPEEFRAIRRACDPVHLSGDFLAVFKYFLVEALDDTLPDLATRIRRFRRPQLVLLYGFLRQQRTAAAKSQEQTRTEDGECGLTAEELQAVRYASDPFFLHVVIWACSEVFSCTTSARRGPAWPRNWLSSAPAR